MRQLGETGMTGADTKLVGFEGIARIGVCCPACQTLHLIPPQNIDAFPRSCPTCNESWMNDAPVAGSSYTDLRAIQLLASMFREIAGREFAKNVRFQITLEEN